MPNSDPDGYDVRLLDLGWEDVSRRLDTFLAGAIRAIMNRCGDKPPNWLEINRWPDSGRLLVFPSPGGPGGDEDDRISCQLTSDYLEHEFLRIADLPDPQPAWDALGKKVWDRVADSLNHGEASRAIADVPLARPLRLAAYDYNFGEGLFRLPELDPQASEEMRRQLAEFRKRFGITT